MSNAWSPGKLWRGRIDFLKFFNDYCSVEWLRKVLNSNDIQERVLADAPEKIREKTDECISTLTKQSEKFFLEWLGIVTGKKIYA